MTTPPLPAAPRSGTTSPAPVTVELPYRAPLVFADSLAYFRARAVVGLEEVTADSYTLSLPTGSGPVLATLRQSPGADPAVRAELRLTDAAALPTPVAALRNLLDLDADPAAVDAVLSTDRLIRRLVETRPGLRSPGTVNGFETALRGLLGQQISVAAARHRLAWFVAGYGRPIFDDLPWRAFPRPEDLASIDPATLPMPRIRGAAVVQVARLCSEGVLRLDRHADPDLERRILLAVPGIGPWTADYLRMRVHGDTDILLVSDLGVRKAAARLGLDLGGGRPDLAPYRSYLSTHLWAAPDPRIERPARDGPHPAEPVSEATRRASSRRP